MELILIYTGNGKGKTCACVGQAMRALGQGLNVVFGQFMKREGQAGEQKILARLLGENFRGAGPGFFRNERERPAQTGAARDLLAWAGGLAWDMLVLDEALYALKRGFIDEKDLRPFLDAAAGAAPHLVLSGRGAPAWLLERAHMVTELDTPKHQLRQGAQAMPGLEY